MSHLQSEKLPDESIEIMRLMEMKLSMIKTGAPEWELAIADDSIRTVFEKSGLRHVPYRTWTVLPSDVFIKALPSLLDARLSESPVHWLCDTISEMGIRGYHKSGGQMGHAISNLRESIDANHEWVNSRDLMGNTPLHWAVYLLASEALEILMESGADTEMENAIGMLALDLEHFKSFCLGTPKLDTAIDRVMFMESFLERIELNRYTSKGGAENDDAESL